MGLPVVAIPDALWPELLTVFRDAGLTAEPHSSGYDESEHFLGRIVCSDERSAVELTIQREPHINDRGPIVIVRPPPRELRKRYETEFSDHIVAILLSHGGWIPKREKAT